METQNQNLNSILENKFSDRKLCSIAQALLKLASDEEVQKEIPDINRYAGKFMSAIEDNNPLELEHALMNLYAKLHSAGSKYSSSERRLLDARNGYSCYAGGLSPIIKAEDFIRPGSVVADIGAANGLQGLLFQYLYPHRKTIQIELSSEMIRIGKILQQALGISNNCIEWINDDILNVSLMDVDFVYIYRPSSPISSGRKIFEAIARKLNDMDKPLVIFSIADCLAEFLNKSFSIFYTDGHLTCFSKE